MAGGALGVQGVNPYVLSYVNSNTPSRSGILMMDFPGGGLINKIVSYNGAGVGQSVCAAWMSIMEIL